MRIETNDELLPQADEMAVAWAEAMDAAWAEAEAWAEEERLREQEAARAATMEAEREYLREWAKDVTRCLICGKELENPMTMVCSKDCQRTLILELAKEVDRGA